MNKIEFQKFVEETLNKLIVYAEIHFGDKLPSEVCLRWSIDKGNVIEGTDKVIDEIVERVYLAEDQIYPCVDLVVIDKINNQKILIEGSIAGYPPTYFQTGWSNRPGPFIYGLNSKFINPQIDTNSAAFKNKLKELKLLFD
ncbi:hypothetical protein [Ohtaekwangia koreensis]|uniref:Uncharacterized protein n=1 Tax=Ohtaekwangia koreensis TaxID=688867 RepID=A0A1T5MH03_9BACT|nr:hypothetical protein [Ohtaekwangia koreensis]SKC87482.1 hypothetical protein SAMN05660236_5431 [Ohtaekwangia koreensis]